MKLPLGMKPEKGNKKDLYSPEDVFSADKFSRLRNLANSRSISPTGAIKTAEKATLPSRAINGNKVSTKNLSEDPMQV